MAMTLLGLAGVVVAGVVVVVLLLELPSARSLADARENAAIRRYRKARRQKVGA